MSKRRDILTSEIIKMFESGFSTYKIAREFGCTQHCIFERLKKIGYKNRNQIGSSDSLLYKFYLLNEEDRKELERERILHGYYLRPEFNP